MAPGTDEMPDASGSTDVVAKLSDIHLNPATAQSSNLGAPAPGLGSNVQGSSSQH